MQSTIEAKTASYQPYTGNQSTKLDPANKLPVELIEGNILTRLSPSDLAAFSLACKKYKQLSEADCIWKGLFARTFTTESKEQDHLKPKDLYRTTVETALENGKKAARFSNITLNFNCITIPEKQLPEKQLNDTNFLALGLNINTSSSEGCKILDKIMAKPDPVVINYPSWKPRLIM